MFSYWSYVSHDKIALTISNTWPQAGISQGCTLFKQGIASLIFISLFFSLIHLFENKIVSNIAKESS